MARCATCGGVKLTERPCPACGGTRNTDPELKWALEQEDEALAGDGGGA